MSEHNLFDGVKLDWVFDCPCGKTFQLSIGVSECPWCGTRYVPDGKCNPPAMKRIGSRDDDKYTTR